MKKLLDLRFVIGVFFTVVGSLLILYHFIGESATESNTMINIWCGVLFLLFGISMIVLSYLQKIEED
jgi:hypothetical protein